MLRKKSFKINLKSFKIKDSFQEKDFIQILYDFFASKASKLDNSPQKKIASQEIFQIVTKSHEIVDYIQEYNTKYKFFSDITGVAMMVHTKYRYGLLENAYEAAMKYLLEQQGFKVERQVFLPIYWDDVKLDQTYRMDLVINDNIIVELKAVKYVDKEHRRQLWNYLNITHMPYGMLINFSPSGLFSEWYKRDSIMGTIEKIKLL